MKKIFIIAIAAASMSACMHKEKNADHSVSEAEASAMAPQKAHAVLKGTKVSKLKGMIHFTEEKGEMKIETMVDGLKPGPHGFHIHEKGDCSAPDFTSAGGHFNPGKGHHADKGVDGSHVGDMGNLMADSKGKAYTTLTVPGMTLKPGDDSIMGKAVIIHQDPDDLKSQPSGNSGPRIACGVIEAL